MINSKGTIEEKSFQKQNLSGFMSLFPCQGRLLCLYHLQQQEVNLFLSVYYIHVLFILILICLFVNMCTMSISYEHFTVALVSFCSDYISSTWSGVIRIWLCHTFLRIFLEGRMYLYFVIQRTSSLSDCYTLCYIIVGNFFVGTY